jgi:hypothetical protein
MLPSAFSHDFRVVDIGAVVTAATAGAGDHPLEPDLAFVVPHAPGMVLGHSHADSPLEPSGVAAGLRVALLPSNRLRAFLEHFD